MIVDRLEHRTVRSALELAGHAPSVHSSQPGQWRLGDRSVHLHADLRRWLPVTDAVLGGALSPQLVLRLGWAPDGHLPATPRRPVDALLDDLSGGRP